MYRLQRRIIFLGGVAMFGVAAGAIAQPPSLLPAASSQLSENYFVWVIQCLGLVGLSTVLTGIAVFLGAFLVVFLTRRPAVIASYLVFPLLTLLLGIFGATKALVSAFGELARTGGQVEVALSRVCACLAEALVTFLVSLELTIPAVLVVAVGLLVRTIQAGKGSPSQDNAATHKVGSNPG